MSFGFSLQRADFKLLKASKAQKYNKSADEVKLLKLLKPERENYGTRKGVIPKEIEKESLLYQTNRLKRKEKNPPAGSSV